MLGWLIDALVISAGSSAPTEPRSAVEASERFFFRSLTVLFGSFLALAGSLVAWLATGDAFRGGGVVTALIGALMVVTGISRLVHLWRAASVLRAKEHPGGQSL